MGILDRPGFARLAEVVQENLGVTVMPAQDARRLKVTEEQFIGLADEVEDLALGSMDYWSGRPTELSRERRRSIAQRSRIALKFDPLASAEAQLLADFAFGKGIPIPTAKEPKVQEVIEEAWTDANNHEKLTGFMAQRKLSNELMTTGELFTTLYVSGGKVRVGRLDPDTVDAVIPDPEDRLRPLWYMVRERRYEWDFDMDMAKISSAELMGNGRPKVMYWKHWRNVDDAIAERGDKDLAGEEPLVMPPAAKIANGVVYHVAINQTGEELRGNPPWARSLRFFEAMNILTQAHVVMAQGASTFIARRVLQGTPRQVLSQGARVMGHLSEIGAARAAAMDPSQQPAYAPGSPPPAQPGSWWTENQSSQLEAFNLKSNAGEMAQTAQIVRAPIAAASGFGQHYLGDASNANLATASTLELPATMRITSWQELFEQKMRWFTDRAIEAAVKAGRLGGLDKFPDDGPISEMRLDEAEDRAAMEKRTGVDLGYEFVMPFPGRRQLPEVGGFVQAIATTMDPNGVSIQLRRQLLRFAFEAMGIANVGDAVEEAIPDKPLAGGIGPPDQTGGGFVPPVVPPGTDPNAIPEGDPRNVKRKSTPPGEKPQTEAWVPPELEQAVAQFEAETATRFDELVLAPALAAVAGSNGNGSGG